VKRFIVAASAPHQEKETLSMIVQELIALLQKMDPKATVYVDSGDDYWPADAHEDDARELGLESDAYGVVIISFDGE
jgi:hypothetical protein